MLTIALGSNLGGGGTDSSNIHVKLWNLVFSFLNGRKRIIFVLLDQKCGRKIGETGCSHQKLSKIANFGVFYSDAFHIISPKIDIDTLPLNISPGISWLGCSDLLDSRKTKTCFMLALWMSGASCS